MADFENKNSDDRDDINRTEEEPKFDGGKKPE